MTDEEIEIFRTRVQRSDLPRIFWRSIDGDMREVSHVKLNYKAPQDDISEPVAVLFGGDVVSLWNSELSDYVELITRQAFV